MIIDKIKITGLFEQFDYTIPLNKEGGVTILTGPNGYGKTMILNILYNFFNGNLSFFAKLIFKQIEIFLSGEKGMGVIIKKIESKDQKPNDNLVNFPTTDQVIVIEFFEDGKEHDSSFGFWPIDAKSSAHDIQDLHRYCEAHSITIDLETGKHYDSGALAGYHPITALLFEINETKNKKKDIIFENLHVNLIKEQRLLRQTVQRSKDESPAITPSILEYAEDLKAAIKDAQAESLKISEKLDGSFPKKLLEKKGWMDNAEFHDRFEKMVEKQERLYEFGLVSNKTEPGYNYEAGSEKVLSLFLENTEEKISVFDDLLAKLELFTNIMNQRRLLFKSVKIDPNRGFSFFTQKNKPLDLKDLSSGEQHEVVLLYELIFKTKPNTLVLIDEPEISLHIAWQNEFLNDIMEIIRLQQIQVLIATHSPQIINEYWDLTVNLETQVEA